MNITNEEYRLMVKLFLNKWPLKRVKNMSLREYDELNDKTTFCHWIEYETSALGDITGVYADKYGIFKIKDHKKIPTGRKLRTDNVYKWIKENGDNRDEAFNEVKSKVISVIEYSQKGEFEKIEKVKLHSFWKWKIAYLYSGEILIPAFKKDLLLFIAKDLNGKYDKKSKISDIQEFIISNRPKKETIYEFSNRMWGVYNSIFSKSRKFYIFGSKYGGKDDVFPLMIKNKIVCTGFAPNENLIELYGKSSEEITKSLDMKLVNYPEKTSAKSTLSLLLQMKPGDMIAIKSSGWPVDGINNLEIIGYAFVVSRDGKVYNFDEKIGHCINVEFIETNIKKNFKKGGFVKTLYDITENKELIKILFQGNESPEVITVRQKTKRRRRKETGDRNTGKQKRKGSKPYIAENEHNKIQIKYADHLRKQYGKENVKIEENFIDIKLIEKDKVTYFEVKPYYWAEDCIRYGLGQLLNYAYFNPVNLPLKLIVIGPNPPDDEEKEIIKFLRKGIKFEFDYKNFS